MATQEQLARRPALLHSAYDQPDATAVHAQYDRNLDTLRDKLPAVADHLDTARADVLAFSVSRSQLGNLVGDRPWMFADVCSGWSAC